MLLIRILVVKILDHILALDGCDEILRIVPMAGGTAFLYITTSRVLREQLILSLMSGVGQYPLHALPQRSTLLAWISFVTS